MQATQLCYFVNNKLLFSSNCIFSSLFGSYSAYLFAPVNFVQPPKGFGPIPEVGAIPGRPAAGGEQALTTHQVPKI